MECWLLSGGARWLFDQLQNTNWPTYTSKHSQSEPNRRRRRASIQITLLMMVWPHKENAVAGRDFELDFELHYFSVAQTSQAYYHQQPGCAAAASQFGIGASCFVPPNQPTDVRPEPKPKPVIIIRTQKVNFG